MATRKARKTTHSAKGRKRLKKAKKLQATKPLDSYSFGASNLSRGDG
jgi:hypothetical protein